MVAYVDGTGRRCHVVEAGEGSELNEVVNVQALRNETESSAATRTWVEELDPLIKWTLLAIFVRFMLMMALDCYFCVFRKAKQLEEGRVESKAQTSYGNVAARRAATVQIACVSLVRARNIEKEVQAGHRRDTR